MAAYRLRNENGVLVTALTINFSVDANTAYAPVCWIGVITDTSGCIGDDYQTYCESIYIGVNTSCSNEKTISGTINWNGCTITYIITQSKSTDCEDCGSSVSECELIDAYVSPYYVPSSARTTTVYYQYWETIKNACKVLSRKRKSSSQEVSIDTSGVACTDDERTIDVPNVDYACGTIGGLKCYVQKPDNCCDHEDDETCYEVSDIFYNPQKVDSSGGTVDFFIDYKKTTYKDCKKKYSYGRFQDSIDVRGCIGRECCKERIKTIPYTWSGHTLCNGKSTINLKIPQKRDIAYTGDCSCNVPSDKGYCVDVHSVKRYHKLGDDTWEEINPLHPYVFPYYGGTMKVSWEYSAITVGDDCYVDITSGNTWEDYIEIMPYSGSVCDGVDYVTINYVFKKSPCAFDEATKTMLPPNLCGEGCYIEADKEFLYGCNGGEANFTIKKDERACTNEFDIEYQQYRKPCSDTCESCFSKFNIELGSGGTDTVTDTATCDITLIENTKPSWLNIAVNGRSVSYSAPINKGSNREGGVTFKLRGEECYDTIIIRQPGSNEEKDPSDTDPTIECNCDTAVFEAYSSPRDLDKNGGTRLIIGSYIFNDCIENISCAESGGYDISYNTQLDCEGGEAIFTATPRGGGGGATFISNVTFEDGAIYGTASQNTTSQDRTCEINITYDIKDCGSGTATISVKQKG